MYPYTFREALNKILKAQLLNIGFSY